MTPLIVTITGPSCAGKSTLEDELIKAGFAAVVSTTTRSPRAGEIDGQDYYFVTHEEFDALERNSLLVESVTFNGNRYAVTRDEIERIASQGKPVVVVVEPHGRDQIKRYAAKQGWTYRSVFVDASVNEIAERFMRRTLNEAAAEFENTGAVIRTFNISSARLAEMLHNERSWVDEMYQFDFLYSVVVRNRGAAGLKHGVSMLVDIAQHLGYLRNAA